MDVQLRELLRCPVDAAAPLELTSLEECSPTAESNEVEQGVLRCPRCQRWFPIIDGIPLLCVDGLRLPQKEIPFLRKYEQKLPQELVAQGKPLNLNEQEVKRTTEEKQIVAEGAYWSEFFEVFFSLDDWAMFDFKARGTHPPFYEHYGVMEIDERDREKPFGFWPPAFAKLFQESLTCSPKGWCLDLGCGGGQLSLAAERQGWQAIGIDVAFEALRLARLYGLQHGSRPHYVYAHAAQLPFHDHTFQLLLSKDALHHVPGIEGVVQGLSRVLAPTGHAFFFEHVGNSRQLRWLFDRVNQCLIPRVLRRYRRKEVPRVLQRGSAHEDVALAALLPTLRRTFRIVKRRRATMLVEYMERLFYFAFGKRRAAEFLGGTLFRLLEPVLLSLFGAQHVALLAKRAKR